MGPLTESLKNDGCFSSAAEDSTTEPSYVRGRLIFSDYWRQDICNHSHHSQIGTASPPLLVPAELTIELQSVAQIIEKIIPLPDLLLHCHVHLSFLVVGLLTCVKRSLTVLPQWTAQQSPWEILTASLWLQNSTMPSHSVVNMKNTVFCDVMSCSLVEEHHNWEDSILYFPTTIGYDKVRTEETSAISYEYDIEFMNFCLIKTVIDIVLLPKNLVSNILY